MLLDPDTCAQARGSTLADGVFAVFFLPPLLYLCICFLLFSGSSRGELLNFRIIRPLPKVDPEAGPCRQWTGNGGEGRGVVEEKQGIALKKRQNAGKRCDTKLTERINKRRNIWGDADRWSWGR